MSNPIEDVQHSLGQKLGPLPAWAWGLILAGLALVAYFVYARSSSTAPATSSSAAAADTSVGEGLGSATGSSSDGSSSGDTSSTPASSLSSNQAWLARATLQVALEFAAGPGAVYTALYNGLAGGSLTQTEMNYWNRAISDLGVPPEGTQGTPTLAATSSSDSGSNSTNTTGTTSGSTAEASGTTTTGATVQPAASAPKIFSNIRRIVGTYDLYGQLNGQWQKITGDDWRNSGSPDAGEWGSNEIPVRYVRVRNTYDVYKWNNGTWSGPLSHDQYVAEGAPPAEEVASAPI